MILDRLIGISRQPLRQAIQKVVTVYLTLAITWPQREANLLNNSQVAAQVHGRVRPRIHPR